MLETEEAGDLGCVDRGACVIFDCVGSLAHAVAQLDACGHGEEWAVGVVSAPGIPVEV
ncbi:hypothetical protein [Segatella copri]|uniref:hypothetical protein n=1 Tax=Segatella copri TaxID=165179 RepID=UPI0015F7DC94|nr:hypothetical protein [Segatella copri]